MSDCAKALSILLALAVLAGPVACDEDVAVKDKPDGDDAVGEGEGEPGPVVGEGEGEPPDGTLGGTCFPGVPPSCFDPYLCDPAGACIEPAITAGLAGGKCRPEDDPLGPCNQGLECAEGYCKNPYPPRCAEYDFLGRTIDCSQVDFCPKQRALTQDELTERLGCCECSTDHGTGSLCNPPPPDACPCLGNDGCDAPALCDIVSGECVQPDCTGDADCEPGTCVDGKCVAPPPRPVEGCMSCHNGSQKNDYAGAGGSGITPRPSVNVNYYVERILAHVRLRNYCACGLM